MPQPQNPDLLVSAEDPRSKVQRRTLRVVVLSQVLGGAGLAAGITVGALLAQDMLGSESLAGLPSGIYTLGSALAAYLVGQSTHRWGRRLGLFGGFFTGGLGAFGVVAAAVTDSVPLLFVSLFIYGAGTATNLQARYAGTDLALPAKRGKAISVAMVSTTLGAVAGPNLVGPLQDLARFLGIPALAGPFLLAGVAYTAAGFALFVLLRPDPLFLARELDARDLAAAPTTTVAESAAAVGSGAYVGATIMVLTQISMIAIMTMTPVHMKAHHHGLSAVGLVIGVHIAAMFLPSLVTGALVDRLGRIPMAIASAVTLLMAGITGATAPGDSLPMLMLALALLGLGWNFGLIAGTALVIDGTAPKMRPKVQGNIDVLIALAGATGGSASGLVMSTSSFATLSLGGGILALLFIPALLRVRRGASPAAT